MNQSKYLNSSIQILKDLLGDQSNELGSEGKRALSGAICKLKRLKRQPKASSSEVHCVIAEVAEAVLNACTESQAEVKSHS